MTDRRPDSDDGFVRDVVARLDDEAGRTSVEERRALRLARAAAVEAAERGPRPGFGWRPALAGAAFAVVIALALVWRPLPQDLPDVAGVAGAPDWVVVGDELDLYEDVDFYLWLHQLDEVV